MLNTRRSTLEKLSDLMRRIAYGSILADLMSIEAVLFQADEHTSFTEAYNYYNSEQFTNHNKTISEHVQSIRKVYKENYLILSDEFIGLYEKMDREMRADDPNNGPEEDHEIFATAVRTARPKLLAQGKSELPHGHDWAARIRKACRKTKVKMPASG